MAAHLRRFTDMHPAAILVASDLSEPAIFDEKEDRRVHGGRSLRESGAPAWTPVLRDPYSHPTE